MAISQDQFKAIISGRRRDARAGIARSLLGAASQGYRLAVHVRTALYDHRLFRTHQVDAAVLSVGNLTVGGTGKTPLVVWLAGHVQSKGLRVAILTRGYKATNQESEIENQKYSDEPALLATVCPGVPVIVNPDRVAGADRAIGEHSAQVLILDDGFQHRRLARDIDIVTIDATSPFGFDKLLPAGLLREPVAALRRAHAVVMTRCDQASRERLAQIERRIQGVNPRAIVSMSVHKPVGAVSLSGAQISLEELQGRKVYAFCGLGNPEAFFETTRGLGCVLVERESFDDHHDYTSHCLDRICRQARQRNADYILTTQKDWTKILRLPVSAGAPPLACLAVELTFIAGADRLTGLIDRVLGGRMPQESGRQQP
jgi:tetraacyldisaccharide 4'-kinase